MKLIHKPISMFVTNERGNHFATCSGDPQVLDVKARSRNYKNCYVVKIGWNTYSFDSNYDYELIINRDGDKPTIEFVKKD